MANRYSAVLPPLQRQMDEGSVAVQKRWRSQIDFRRRLWGQVGVQSARNGRIRFFLLFHKPPRRRRDSSHAYRRNPDLQRALVGPPKPIDRQTRDFNAKT